MKQIEWEPGKCREAVFAGLVRRGCLMTTLHHVVHRNGPISWWGRIGKTQIRVAEESDGPR